MEFDPSTSLNNITESKYSDLSLLLKKNHYFNYKNKNYKFLIFYNVPDLERYYLIEKIQKKLKTFALIVKDNEIDKLRKLNNILKLHNAHGLLVNSSFYYSKFHHFHLKNLNLTNFEFIYFSEIAHYANVNWPYDLISNFNDNFKKNHELINDLKNRMSDLNKQFLDNFLNFFNKGSPLEEIEYRYENTDPFGLHGLKVPDNYCFVDIGAYDGGEIKKVLANNSNYKKIYAFEPDKDNFNKLKANFENFKNIELMNVGVSNKNCEIGFDFQSNMGSRINKDSLNKTKFIILDDLSIKADIIKIDVEGFEKDVLEGATKTIDKFKPNLCISIYHHSTNLTDVYSLLRDKYKHFAFRSASNCHLGSTLYASDKLDNHLFSI